MLQSAHSTGRGEPDDRAIPVPQERIVGVETVEALALQGVAFDVPAAALLLRIPLMWNAESGDLERGFRRSGTLVGGQRRLVSQ